MDPEIPPTRWREKFTRRAGDLTVTPPPAPVEPAPTEQATFPLTSEQKAEVEKLVATGWNRADAEHVVVETTEDVDFTPPAVHVAPELASLVTFGAMLHFYDGSPAMPVGAAGWIEGRGLLIAELWAQHQGQVHLFSVTHLADDGPDLDLYAGDILLGSLISFTADEISTYDLARWKGTVASDAWRRFWKSQIDASSCL